ncbi:MAG: ComF family protein [Candidatus Saccharimonadales bacterium]
MFALLHPRWLRPAVAGTVRRARRTGQGFCELVFPIRCALCDAELAQIGDAIRLCGGCRSKLAKVDEDRCPRCALPLRQASASELGCPICHDEQLHFSRAWALGDYAGELRAAALRMKHAREEVLSAAVGQLFWSRYGEAIAVWRPGLVVPVPMHWLRRSMRGTNSAATLAETVAQRLNLPYNARLVVRRRHTQPQSGLSPAERLANVRGAFRVRKNARVAEMSVLLVDDIMTTGATCNEIARLLRRAGAGRVALAVAARADDRERR